MCKGNEHNKIKYYRNRVEPGEEYDIRSEQKINGVTPTKAKTHRLQKPIITFYF